MDRYNGEDPFELLEGMDIVYDGNKRNHIRHTAWDQWDDYYGCGYLDYEVYILADYRKPGIYKFGPLEVYHEPFYVGSGKKNRSKASCNLWSQKEKGGRKVKKLEEMCKQKKEIIRYIVKRFYTEPKARVVELKLLNVYINSLPTNFVLTNSEYRYCDIPLHETDYIQPNKY